MDFPSSNQNNKSKKNCAKETKQEIKKLTKQNLLIMDLWEEYCKKQKKEPENAVQLFNFCKQKLQLNNIRFHETKKVYDRHQKRKKVAICNAI
jgi:hypothetical protein